jgi:GT2 family glycosyltransferase
MLVRREVFKEIGLLNTSLFMYAEEVDFIWRARLAGYRVGCVTNAHLFHKISLSANRDRPQQRYWRIRNQIFFYRKYTYGMKLALMFFIVLARSLWIGTKDIFHGQKELLSSLIRGWRDGWFTQNVLEEN